MAEVLDESAALESTTVGVYRTAATVKGGRRFSFGALVVVGDRNGHVGIGYGKANMVPPAIEKAQKEARRRMRLYPLQGRTIPHTVTGRFGACVVRLIPASPGTGVIAGAAVRAPLEMLGVRDCLTKSFGSNNPKNLVKAVTAGLAQLRSKEVISALRGLDLGTTAVEEFIQRGEAYAADQGGRSGEPALAPVNIAADTKRRRKRSPRGGKGPRGVGPAATSAAAGSQSPQAAADPTPPAGQAEAPAAEDSPS